MPSLKHLGLLQVSVRLAALNSIANLLAASPTDEFLAKLWVRAALPLIKDSETRCKVRTRVFFGFAV